jgi:hypothetical protein
MLRLRFVTTAAVEVVRSFSGHGSEVSSITVLGNRLLTTSWDCSVRLSLSLSLHLHVSSFASDAGMEPRDRRVSSRLPVEFHITLLSIFMYLISQKREQSVRSLLGCGKGARWSVSRLHGRLGCTGVCVYVCEHCRCHFHFAFHYH